MEETGVKETRPEEQENAQLRQELEKLRLEQRRRELLEETQKVLQERGIDPRFAPFVQGQDSEDTRRRAEQFDRQLSDALKRHLSAHLPQGEPRDFSARRPAVRRPGIRRVSR